MFFSYTMEINGYQQLFGYQLSGTLGRRRRGVLPNNTLLSNIEDI